MALNGNGGARNVLTKIPAKDDPSQTLQSWRHSAMKKTSVVHLIQSPPRFLSMRTFCHWYMDDLKCCKYISFSFHFLDIYFSPFN